MDSLVLDEKNLPGEAPYNIIAFAVIIAFFILIIWLLLTIVNIFISPSFYSFSLTSNSLSLINPNLEIVTLLWAATYESVQFVISSSIFLVVFSSFFGRTTLSKDFTNKIKDKAIQLLIVAWLLGGIYSLIHYYLFEGEHDLYSFHGDSATILKYSWVTYSNKGLFLGAIAHTVYTYFSLAVYPQPPLFYKKIRP